MDDIFSSVPNRIDFARVLLTRAYPDCQNWLLATVYSDANDGQNWSESLSATIKITSVSVTMKVDDWNMLTCHLNSALTGVSADTIDWEGGG